MCPHPQLEPQKKIGKSARVEARTERKVFHLSVGLWVFDFFISSPAFRQLGDKAAFSRLSPFIRLHRADESQRCKQTTKRWRHKLHSANQSINQSIDQSINQSINQWSNQSITQSIDQSIDRSINQSINRSRNCGLPRISSSPIFSAGAGSFCIIRIAGDARGLKRSGKWSCSNLRLESNTMKTIHSSPSRLLHHIFQLLVDIIHCPEEFAFDAVRHRGVPCTST